MKAKNTQYHQRRWNKIGHILRTKNELVYRITEGKIEGQRNQGHSRTVKLHGTKEVN
jgi:hypothetical protein